MEKLAITEEGLKKLQEELQDLIMNKRKDVIEKMKEAREQGDLSENADYDAAREEHGKVESRINEIKNILSNIEVGNKVQGIVNLGSKVKLYDLDYEEEIEYIIVGTSESDSLHNKISNESPIGKELLNKEIGDIVSVKTPNGIIKFKILNIEN